MPPPPPPQEAASSPPPPPGDAAEAAPLPLLHLPPAGAVGTGAGPRRDAALPRGRPPLRRGRLPDLQRGEGEGEGEGEERIPGEAQHCGRAVGAGCLNYRGEREGG